MNKINLLLLMSLTTINSWTQEQTLEKGWKFTREDKPAFSQTNYNDAKWQRVTVPHDWAIYGPFDMENDIQRTAIKQDGQNYGYILTKPKNNTCAKCSSKIPNVPSATGCRLAA